MANYMRLEMGYSGLMTPRIANMVLEYNLIISTHGIVMLFAFVMPVGFASLANYLLPLEIGVCELVFPRLNILSFWLFFLGAGLYVQGALTQVTGIPAG